MYRNNFGDTLEKVITTPCAILAYRNNVVFKNFKCNPIFVLELANKYFYETTLSNKCTKFSSFVKIAGSNLLDAGNDYNWKNWAPSPIDWIKYNTDASTYTINRMMPISDVGRDNIGHIITKNGRKTWSIPVLVEKTLAIWTTLKHTM